MGYRREHHQRQQVRERSVGVLALIALLAFTLVAGAIIAYYFVPNPDLLFKQQKKAQISAKLVKIDIQDGELLVPNYFIARIKRRALGTVERVDLQVPWPFTGAAPKTQPQDATDFNDSVLITYQPLTDNLPEQTRLQNIYKYYFGGRPVDGPGGLKRYSFGSDTPYADIQLYIGELDHKQVHLRCDLRKSSLGPILCSRMLKISATTAIRYRFSRAHLEKWKLIDATVRRLHSNIFHRRAGS